MLEPQDRQLLLDCLRPPEGYHLDRAVGTSYSLDLYALLAVPVAFVFQESVTEEGRVDALAMLEAVRRCAERIHLFCQSGEIQVPRKSERLFAYLEDCVVPVNPPRSGGVFHPKLWVLRFTADDDPAEVSYRAVCLSRNLTFDRSWDTALVLDGALEPGNVRKPHPAPLARFVGALPGLAVQDAGPATREAVAGVADELARVRFEPPPGVETLKFWPMGLPGTTAPSFEPAHRALLVMAPFLSERWLDRHVRRRPRAVLVSRDDSLLPLPEELRQRFDPCYVLAEEATPEADVESQGDEDVLLDGLHAKLFLMDDGWTARLWTGSANATEAAFSLNVEFLVELAGKKGALGIDALLAEAPQGTAFRDLLEPWSPPAEAPPAPDPVAERLERRLWEARQALASADLAAEVGEASADGLYPIAVRGVWPALPEGVTATVRPVSFPPEQARAVDGGTVDFGAATLEALSAFFAIELTATEAGQSQRARFVLRLATQGMPADRKSQLLRRLLQDRGEFMRLLLMLLAADPADALLQAGPGAGSSARESWLTGGNEAPLLESLLRALDRSPERLDQIHRLLADLQEAGRLEDMLPDGFLPLWEAVWTHRLRMDPNAGHRDSQA